MGRKLLSIMLVIALVAALFSGAVYAADKADEASSEYAPVCHDCPGETSELIDYVPQKGSAEDYRAWAQGDSRWGSIAMGSSGSTVSQIGCTVTAVTKLIIQCGLKDSSSFNVGTLVTWLNNNGGFTGDGSLYWGKPSEYVSGFSNYGNLLSYGTYSSSGYNDQIISWIKAGYHMTISVNGGGHWVAVDEAKSLATGTVYIMDSLTGYTNADIKLSARYTSFVQIHAYTGGSTGGTSEPVDPVSGTPIIKSSKTVYEYGETVVLERNAVENTNFYWIVVWYKDEQLLSTKMEDTTYNLNNLSPGTYTVYLQVGNSAGTVTSEKCTFYVVQKISETPVISSDKARYSVGEPVTLSRNSVDNTNFYWIVVWYQDKQLLSAEMATQTYQLNGLEAGMYCVYLTVGNSLGKVTSEPYEFVVEDEHAWDSGVVTRESSCKTQGVIKYTCNICGMEREEFLPLKPHSYDSLVISAPTCTEQGYTTHTCTVCGDSYTDSYVDALGHCFVDGVCIRCGLQEGACDGGADCPSRFFVDAPAPGNWAHAGIDFVVENGLFNGTSDTTFSPSASMTRAMLVTVLWRLDGEPASGGTNPFADVPAGKYYTNAVVWAAENGIVTGADATHFNPKGNVTREQMAAILFRYAAAKDYSTTEQADLSAFPDVGKVSNYAKNALAWANAEGLITGDKQTNGTVLLSPKGNATRAQVAAIFMRFVENVVGQ